MQHCNRDARAFFCRPPFTTPNVSLDLLSLALLLLICSAPCTARSRFKRPCRGRTGQHQSPHSQASPCRCASDPPLRFLTVRFTTAPCVHVTPLIPLCPWPSHHTFSSRPCFASFRRRNVQLCLPVTVHTPLLSSLHPPPQRVCNRCAYEWMRRALPTNSRRPTCDAAVRVCVCACDYARRAAEAKVGRVDEEELLCRDGRLLCADAWVLCRRGGCRCV
jgi:hypothetical protein